jgi:hypothetical protein
MVNGMSDGKLAPNGAGRDSLFWMELIIAHGEFTAV